MEITKNNIKELIRKNFSAQKRILPNSSWDANRLLEKDVDDILHFYRNSFTRGLLESPAKTVPVSPYPHNGTFYRHPRWFLKEYLGGKLTYKHRERLLGRDFDVLEDSGVVFPVYDSTHDLLFFNFGGKAFSANSRKYGSFTALIRSYAGRAKNICEIGAGYGGMCEISLLNHNVGRYTIIDLFQTLGISMTYLLHSPTARDYKLIYVETAKDLENLPDKCILFISNMTFKKIKNDLQGLDVDLFINSSSFVEMDKNTIQEYFDFIQSYSNVHFFSSNSMGRYEIDEYLSAKDFPYDSHWTHIYETVTHLNKNDLSRISYHKS